MNDAKRKKTWGWNLVPVAPSNSSLTTTTRSGVAQWLFPRLSKKDAGIKVATDIQRYPELGLAMRRAGYQSHKIGYTNQQIEILKKFYKKQ